MRRREDPNDPLLLPLLRAATESERAEVLERLLCEHAYPPIDHALDSRYRQSSLSPAHREDLRAEILLRLINRLHAFVHDPHTFPVASFRDYVAVVAFNTFDTFLRRSYPQRSALKNRIRYALRHDPRLAEWQCGGEWVGGLAQWKERRDAIEQLVAPVVATTELRELLCKLFESVQKPVTVNALVLAASTVYETPVAEAVPSQPTVADDLANAQLLRDVWSEICELPLKQRIALLLNARDAAGESVLRFLPVTGVASARQIGDTLAIDAGKLVEIWNELPLEDTKIAVILQVTRQQVINLRQAARHRLARRLRKEPGRGKRIP